MTSRSNSYHYEHISSGADPQVKLGPGALKGIVVNDPIGDSTITVADDDGSTSTTIATITNVTEPTGPYYLEFNVRFTRGLSITTSGADDLTIVYS